MRTTKRMVEWQLNTLNNKLQDRGADRTYILGNRNGYYAIDYTNSKMGSGSATLDCGLSLRECYQMLRAINEVLR